MQRGIDGKGQRNAMTLSAGCAAAVAVTNSRCGYQQKTCTHTHAHWRRSYWEEWRQQNWERDKRGNMGDYGYSKLYTEKPKIKS